MTTEGAIAATIQKMEFENGMDTAAKRKARMEEFRAFNAFLDQTGRPPINSDEVFSEIEPVLSWHPIVISHEGDSNFDGDTDTYVLNVRQIKFTASDGLKLILADKLITVIQAAAITRTLIVLVKGRIKDVQEVVAPASAAFYTAIDELMSCRNEKDLINAVPKAGQILNWGRKETGRQMLKIWGGSDGGQNEA